MLHIYNKVFRRIASVALVAACLTARGAGSSLDDALALCRRTYEYVAKSIPANEAKRFAQEMAVDAKWAATAKTPAERAIVEKVVRRLRRRILFAHPDLQFDRLLCVQRDVPYSRFNHMIDQYLGRFSHAGPGLVVIENWRTFPEKKLLLAGKLPTGCVLNPDLHWDADRVIFAFCDHTRKPEADAEALKVPKVDPSETLDRATVHRRYFIYECAIDGSWVRQLTGGPGDPMETAGGRQTVLIEDMDPCYLPDGGFVFTSTRCQTFGRCHWGRYTPSFLLYRGEVPPVGAPAPYDCRIRRLSFGEANEWEPSVLDDGRIAFTRWLVATATPHHGITGGSLYILDPRKGEDGLAPITRLTPEVPFPESEGWKQPGTYAAPMPVNDTLFFASYCDDPGWYPHGHPQWAGGMAAWPEPRSSAIWLSTRTPPTARTTRFRL